MSAATQGWVWENSPYRSGSLLVHLALGDVANDGHNYELWLTIAALAKKARLGRTATKTALAQLVEDGYIEIIEQGGKGRNSPTRYRFLMPVRGQNPTPNDTSKGSESDPLTGARKGSLSERKGSVFERKGSESDPLQLKDELKEPNNTTSAPSALVPPTASPRDGSLSSVSEIDTVFDAWLTSTKRTRGRTVLDAKRRRLITQALASYPIGDVVDAVRGWERSPHHRGENDRGQVYNDLGLLLRDAEHIERFRDLQRRPKSEPPKRDFLETESGWIRNPNGQGR